MKSRDVGRTASGDGEARQTRRIDRQLERQRDRAGRKIEIMGEDSADHFRLLMDLFVHEVPVIAAVDLKRGGRSLDVLAGDRTVLRVVEFRPLPREHDVVALFEIGEFVGQRRQRQRVGA